MKENQTVVQTTLKEPAAESKAKKWKRGKKQPTIVKLTCGSTAKIEQGVGRHMVVAQRLMDGDQSKFLPALMSQLVTIDDEKLTMEDFIDEMDIVTYQELMEYFSDVNFPTEARK